MNIEQRLKIIRSAKVSLLALAIDTSTNSLTTSILRSIADLLEIIIEDMERESSQQVSNRQTPPSQ